MDEHEKGMWYQIVCSSGTLAWKEAIGWLSEQAGHEFATGEVIEHIDQFQVVPCGFHKGGEAAYRVVATCSIYRPMQE